MIRDLLDRMEGLIEDGLRDMEELNVAICPEVDSVRLSSTTVRATPVSQGAGKSYADWESLELTIRGGNFGHVSGHRRRGVYSQISA